MAFPLEQPWAMASVATATDPDIVKDDVISEAVAQKQRRQTFSGVSATTNTKNIAAEIEDDIATLTCRRSSDTGDRGGSLLISDATRRFIENMPDTQVQNARQALAGVKRQRRLSRIKLGVGPDVREMLGDVRRRSSSSRRLLCDDVGACDDLVVCDEAGECSNSAASIASIRTFGSRGASTDDSQMLGDDNDADDDFFVCHELETRHSANLRRGSSNPNVGVNLGRKKPSGRFTQSMGQLDEDDSDDNSLDLEDVDSLCSNEDEDEGTSEKRVSSNSNVGVNLGREKPSRQFTQSMGQLDQDNFDDNSLDLEDVDSLCSNEDEDEDTSEKKFRKSLGALAFSFDDIYRSEKHCGQESRPLRRVGATEEVADKVLRMKKPSAQQFYRDLNRRSAVVSGKWKPLSSDWRRPKEQGAAPPTVPEEGGGVGTWWKKMGSSFRSQRSLFQQPPKQAKNIDGAAYFRRGKRKGDKCDFLQAAALYNLALVKQREELGENHLDCGATLNEIGVCWMMLGEHYPAMTAFEEALYIRQLCLGAGAPELAETTNNIWMLLHEQRAELEDLLEEKGEEEE